MSELQLAGCLGAWCSPFGESASLTMLEFVDSVVGLNCQGDETVQVRRQIQRHQYLLDGHRETLQEHVVQGGGVPPTHRQSLEVDGIVANGATALSQPIQFSSLLSVCGHWIESSHEGSFKVCERATQCLLLSCCLVLCFVQRSAIALLKSVFVS